MNGDNTVNDRRFYRSSEKRVLGGVCGGLSDYFGFNLKATRFLAVIGLFTPASFFVVASYLLAVVLIPSAPPVAKPGPGRRSRIQAHNARISRTGDERCAAPFPGTGPTTGAS